MSTASLLPAASRTRRRRRPSIRRLAAWLAALASYRKTAPWLVIGFAALHAWFWTFILINLKAAQDVHMDVAEAFAWGQKLQLGYGKHPPLAGWVAGLWFKVFLQMFLLPWAIDGMPSGAAPGAAVCFRDSMSKPLVRPVRLAKV